MLRPSLTLVLAAAAAGCGADPTDAHVAAATPGAAPQLASGSTMAGVRAFVRLDDKAWEEKLNTTLHFCVFDNGPEDWVYAGVKYGLWSAGEFDLRVGGRLVFTGQVEHLLYGGVLMPMGDVVQGQLDHSTLQVTRVTGMFK